MATIGLSKPYFAVYSASGTTVTYSNGGLIGKYTEMNIEVESADDNILYADNAAAESDKTMTGGSFTMSTDNLSLTTIQKILGVTAGTTQNPWTVFDDTQTVPYLGVGGIIKKRVSNADVWVAFVLDKIQFATPSIAAVTQGESIEWQTQELTATIMRSDATNHPWFRMQECSTEALAETAVKTFLSIT